MKRTKKALALILAVCMLIGIPLSVDVSAESNALALSSAMIVPEGVATAAGVDSRSIILNFNDDVTIDTALVDAVITIIMPDGSTRNLSNYENNVGLAIWYANVERCEAIGGNTYIVTFESNKATWSIIQSALDNLHVISNPALNIRLRLFDKKVGEAVGGAGENQIDGKVNGITAGNKVLAANSSCVTNGQSWGASSTKDAYDIEILAADKALSLESAEWVDDEKVAVTFNQPIVANDEVVWAGMRIVNSKNEAMYLNPSPNLSYTTSPAEGAESLSAAITLTDDAMKTVATITETSTITTAAFNKGMTKTYKWFRSHLDYLKNENPNETYRLVVVVESKEDTGLFINGVTSSSNGSSLVCTERGKAMVDASSYNDPIQLEKVTMIGNDKLEFKFSAPVKLHNSGSYGIAIMKDGKMVDSLYQGSFNGQITDANPNNPNATVSDTWTVTVFKGGQGDPYYFTGKQIADFASKEWIAKHLNEGGEIGVYIREISASTHDSLIDVVYTENGRKLKNTTLGKCIDEKETLFVPLDDLFFTPKAYVADGGTLLLSTPGLGGIGAWSGARLFLRAYDENGAVLTKDGQPLQWTLSAPANANDNNRYNGANGTQYCSSVLTVAANHGVSNYHDIVALLDKTYPDGYDLQMVLDDNGVKNGLVESMTRYSAGATNGWIRASEEYSTASADVAAIPFEEIVTVRNVSVTQTGQVLVTFSHDINVEKLLAAHTNYSDFFLSISPTGTNNYVTQQGTADPLAQTGIGDFVKYSSNQILGKVNADQFKTMMDTFNARKDTDNWEIRLRIEMESNIVKNSGTIPVNTNIVAVDADVMSPYLIPFSSYKAGRTWSDVEGCEPQLTMKVEQKSEHVLVATFGRNVKGTFVPEAVILNDSICKPYVGLRMVNETNSLIYSKLNAGVTIASLVEGKAMQWSAQKYELTDDGTQMVITFADNVNISDIMDKSNLPAGLVNFPIKLCIEESLTKNGVTDSNCVTGNGKVWSVVSAADPESQLIGNKTFGAGTWDGHYAEFTPLDPNAPIEVKDGAATITGPTTLSFEWTEAVEMGDAYRGIRFVDENGLLLYYDAEAGTVSTAAKGTALQWSVRTEYADSSKSKVKVIFGGGGRLGVLDLGDLLDPAADSEWGKVKALYPNGTFKLCFEESAPKGENPNKLPGIMETFKGVDGKIVLAQPLIGNLNDAVWIDIQGEVIHDKLNVTSVKAVSDAIVEVTFSAPVKILSNPYTALRAYQGNDLLYYNTLTQEFTKNTEQTNADGQAMYKDAEGNATTEAVAADGTKNTAIGNTPVQWAAVLSSMSKDQTVARYSFEGRDGVPVNGMTAILNYDWASLGAKVVFCFEESGAHMVTWDQHVNNIVRADNENVTLEGNFFVQDRDKYLSSIEMCFTPNPITAKATVINDLQIRVTFSQPVELGNTYWAVRMMDKNGELMFNENRSVAYQWSGLVELDSKTKTSAIWTLNPNTSILGAANLYDLLNYKGVLEQFKDEGSFYFCIEEKDTAEVKTGRRNYIVETVSSLDGTNHLVGQTTSGYDSFTQKLGNGGLSGDELTLQSVTAIDEHTLKVKFSRGVTFKEGDEEVSMALRYLTESGDSDVMVDGKTAIFKGTWKYNGDDKSTIIWTLNSKHTDSLTDLLTYAGNFKWNSTSKLSFVIMDQQEEYFCPKKSMRINGVMDVSGLHHLLANYATKDFMMTQMSVDVAYELPVITQEPETVVEYYSNYTPFITIASVIGLAVVAIAVVIVSKKKTR